MVNAFWLDRDLPQAAAWLVDAHVTSSVFECSMVLTTAARLRGYPDPDDELSITHVDHPLTQWTAASHDNWLRLRAYVAAVHDEWRYRWDHASDERHASWEVVESLDDEAVRDLDWPSTEGSDPPQVTSGWRADDYVDAYRYYYANEKQHLFEWSKDRSAPPWIEAYTVADEAESEAAGETAGEAPGAGEGEEKDD